MKTKENEHDPELSKNIIFPAKLSFEERYPAISDYITPDSIKKIRDNNKKKD